MAYLSPNETYEILGVSVREKIIPDGTRWKNAKKAKNSGFSVGSLYKKQKKLSGGTGVARFVTIHNTNDLANTEDDAEQYTRATYNENMNSVRVHFYVDDLGAWQNLKAGTGLCKNDPISEAEVGWHAGDGSTADGGNMTSIGIEIIMNDSDPKKDEKSKDNGARLAAWLLRKHGLTVGELVTHTYWVNRLVGKTFSDPDLQSTNPVSGRKWCPAYLFGSTKQSVALENWRKFKALVQTYLDELDSLVIVPNRTEEQNLALFLEEEISSGDLVSISDGACYYDGSTIPGWVKEQNWFVMERKGDRAVINLNEDCTVSIRSPIHRRFLQVVRRSAAKEAFRPYLVRIKNLPHTIYQGPGTNYPVLGRISEVGTYTVVAESDGIGAERWGKLKSGIGWISLYGTERRG